MLLDCISCETARLARILDKRVPYHDLRYTRKGADDHGTTCRA